MKKRRRDFAVLAAVLLTACAMSGGRYVEVRPNTRVGLQMIPQEINSAMQDLGYDRVRIKETTIDWGAGGPRDSMPELEARKGVIIVTHSEYRMRFQYEADRTLHVEARIRRDDGRVRLYLSQKDQKELGPTGEEQLKVIQDRMALHFGQAHVRVE